MQNSPINTLQQLMIITAEECGELTQRCSKIVRKFEYKEEITDEQRVKLLEEIGDVQCMIELMIDHEIVSHHDVATRSNYKRDKLKKWSTLIE